MPMDIRSFFSSKKKPPPNENNADVPAIVDKATTATSKKPKNSSSDSKDEKSECTDERNATKVAINAKTSSDNNKPTTKNVTQESTKSNNTSSQKVTEKSSSRSRSDVSRKSNKKRLVIVDDSDDDSVVEVVDKPKKSVDVVDLIESDENDKIQFKKDTKMKDQNKRIEISADDFFREKTTKISPHKLHDSSDEESDEKLDNFIPSPSKRHKPSLSTTNESATKPRRSSPKRGQNHSYAEQLEGQDENSEEKTPPNSDKKVSNRTSTNTARVTKAQKQVPDKPLQPSLEVESFDMNTALSEILNQYTFVFTGVLRNMSREEAQDMVKILGGRVTSTVSKKTNYLVFGDILEDGRPYTEGSKYNRAVSEGTYLVKGENALFGLIKQYNDKAKAATKDPDDPENEEVVEAKGTQDVGNVSSTTSLAKQQPEAKLAIKPANPYAKSGISNPYASKNPYAAKSKPTNSVPTTAPSNKVVTLKKDTQSMNTLNQLWVDKYKPENSSDILGNQDAVRKLSTWLASWERQFNNPQSVGKSFSAPNGPWKGALLSGPPGIGKTTTATLVARESGRDVLEFNASDVRSKKAMQDELGDITGSRTLEFKKTRDSKRNPRKKRCIIMDEVDGMGAGDRSGMAELIQMIKHSRVPVICICNDRQNQKMKSLLPYCMDLKYRRPMKTVVATRAVEIASQEGLNVERNAAEAIVESCGNDIRQVLNCLQMWASGNSRSSSNMTYKDLKEREHSINKDAILRVSLFDATRMIVEGRRGLNGADQQMERKHFFQRSDAFFVDYSFIGLMVQQNYLKVMQPQFNEVKRQNSQLDMLEYLDRMSDAAMTMSDFALAESALRDGQNWSLLPFNAALAVKTGYHAGGENGGMLTGFPEFTTWLGRNSSKGKKVRLLNELAHHLNFSVSGGTNEVRLSYLPILRDRLLSLLLNKNNSDSNVDSAIAFMDEYGLDRDDVFEKLDEFKIDPKGIDFSKMDSKMKAAFTRLYNQGVHRSQALVAEQGGAKRSKRSGGGGGFGDLLDPDAIDDDNVSQENDEDEEELDEEKIKAMFKKKGRSTSAASKAKQKEGITKKKQRTK